MVEARTATGGSISQRPNGLECRETRGGSSTVLVTWPEAGYNEHGGDVRTGGGGHGLSLLNCCPSSTSEPKWIGRKARGSLAWTLIHSRSPHLGALF